MKALMLKPEYVADIISGDKTVEYRSWPTNFRGDILLGCSATRYARGYLAAIVEITDCQYDRVDGVYVWSIDNVRCIEPVPIIGKLRLFETGIQLSDVRIIETDDEINEAYDKAEEWLLKRKK